MVLAREFVVTDHVISGVAERCHYGVKRCGEGALVGSMNKFWWNATVCRIKVHV